MPTPSLEKFQRHQIEVENKQPAPFRVSSISYISESRTEVTFCFSDPTSKVVYYAVYVEQELRPETAAHILNQAHEQLHRHLTEISQLAMELFQRHRS